jgi:hypothetical protein
MQQTFPDNWRYKKKQQSAHIPYAAGFILCAPTVTQFPPTRTASENDDLDCGNFGSHSSCTEPYGTLQIFWLTKLSLCVNVFFLD